MLRRTNVLLPRVLVASLTAVLITALATPAAAAPPRELSGTFGLVGSEPGPERIVGNGKVVFIESVILAVLEGDLVSTEPNREQSICKTLVHRGTTRCHGTVTFTGTVAGIEGEGTLTSRTQLACDLSTYTCTGRNVVVQGTGALAGVRGQTAITVDLSTGTGTYTSSLTGT